MIIHGLKKKLCRDLLIDAAATDIGSVAITTFTYPNGDSVNLYFGNMGGDSLSVSDEGATVKFLKEQGIELPVERRNTIQTMCRQFDVEFVTPVIRRQFEMADLGAACIALCEAITAVAAIFYHVETPVRSSLPVAVDTILRKKVEPKRGVERQWIDKRHDPEGSFPVDFRMNGIGSPRNIFPVTSTSKALMVVAVANFLRSHSIKGKSMAIVDKDAGLGPRDVNRLQLTADEIVHGIDESRIVQFALSSGKAIN
jgi:hypothetical protein